jgi:hypothetical protein
VFLASAYSDWLYAEPTFTQQQLSDYYDLYADEYEQDYGVAKDDSRPCDLRCIFLVPETDDEEGWADAEEQAQALQAQWQADATEEHFAALADEYNQDTQADEGGLYASVQSGQAETVIDDWCFDASRVVGDETLLQIDSGYVLIYYAAQGDTPCWQLSAEADLRYETYYSTIRSLVDAQNFAVDRAVIVLPTPSGITSEEE